MTRRYPKTPEYFGDFSNIIERFVNTSRNYRRHLVAALVSNLWLNPKLKLELELGLQLLKAVSG